MKLAWDLLIRRAETLRLQNRESGELLDFYASLLGAQRQSYEFFRGRSEWIPSGSLPQDLPVIRTALYPLLATVEANGSELLAAEARRLQQAGAGEIDELMLLYWRAPSDTQFFAKAFLQPYAFRLAELDRKPLERSLEKGEARCPFCGGKPQLSVLKVEEAGAEAGGRHLLCSTCLSTWPYRRVVCAGCGEERPERLGYFHTPAYDHLRIEACDTCNHYIKTIDLTKFGFAVPLVDEVAAAPLDLWARERGYLKVEQNLVGL